MNFESDVPGQPSVQPYHIALRISKWSRSPNSKQDYILDVYLIIGYFPIQKHFISKFRSGPRIRRILVYILYSARSKKRQKFLTSA